MKTEVKGNPVRFRSGPAAVTGDESQNMPLPIKREGLAGRKIREPEDLSTQTEKQCVRQNTLFIYSRIKKGNPRSLKGFGFFCVFYDAEACNF